MKAWQLIKHLEIEGNRITTTLKGVKCTGEHFDLDDVSCDSYLFRSIILSPEEWRKSKKKTKGYIEYY